MRSVLEQEPLAEEELLRGVSSGRIAIPANRHHRALRARAFGEGCRTKVNVNLGVSADASDAACEEAKVELALRLGADALMDLSLGTDTQAFRKSLVERCPLPLGTVPTYDAVSQAGGKVARLTVDDFFAAVEEHARAGVDFVTIHAGLTKTCLERLERNARLTRVVSRGGSVLVEWMLATGRENPFYEHFDRLLEIARSYDVTLSLGDGLRPGCLADATDAPQVQELLLLGELTKRAWEAEVQVLIEGPGHIPLHEVAANMQLAKKLCHGAPLYVLGPIVTDVAPGYDHITAAIGGAVAAWNGADFLCYVTPAEHVRLPTVQDVEDGLAAARIAAHAADVAKGFPRARNWDDDMSRARASLDWKGMCALALNPQKASAMRESSLPKDAETCTMCGDFCAVKRSRDCMTPRR